MRRGTTPTIKLNISGLSDLTALDELYVTIKQGEKIITKTTDEVTVDADESQLIVELSEAETLMLEPVVARVQLRAKADDGKLVATNIAQLNVRDVLYNKEIM